ncbi:MAG: beta-galactosidase [Candidatus Hydrogenedentes bacterium]|nr:beta-galactosidase [Candidatus Hydrogenedentota bacterium]
MICMLLMGLAAADGVPAAREAVFESFENEALPGTLVLHNVDVERIAHGEGHALQVDFEVVDWPNVFFQAPEGGWDWGEYSGIAVDIYNPTPESVNVAMRVDNAGADGANHCNTASTTALPGEVTTLKAAFRTGGCGPFWGMRGVPILGPVTRGSNVDPSCIVAFQVFLPRPSAPHRLVLDNIRLYGGISAPLEDLVAFPFVDRFGQYRHDDWPGKVHSEEELTARREAEAAALEQAAAASMGLDAYGGWADGPQLEATGWFRTEQIDGKWWLVTPDGHLFFSTGMDCVGTWQQTFVEKRETWFEWLPGEDSPFAAFYGRQSGAHSMAEPIDGEGRTFGFYCANLLRKYGEDWPERWRATTYARLKAWGFNTIANWSQQDVLENSPMPFVVSAGVRGDVRRIEAGGGYWSKMIDVFDPAFAEAADRSLAPTATRYGQNPLCIGYFVDNEMSWEGVRRGVLPSPPDQPCREALVRQLKEKYGSIRAVNEAWGTDAADWAGLREPANATAAFTQDMDDFEYAFARQYFETVQNALRTHAPNQLYLGCRFSSAPPAAVRAAGDVIDVVSFNRYEETIRCEKWTGENDIGKPLIIGEFHFGALDRGMFHTGLVGAEDQEDRARKYAAYVRSVADCPAFVGCHWFQYIDEPITGRWFDGENYNIGFVDATDSPYPEMIEAARQVHAEVYARRYGRPER